MIQRIFTTLLNTLSKISGKKIVYFSKHNHGTKSAVQSDRGFWYCGDVTDTADIAYGILNNGEVEPEETRLVERLLHEILEKKSELHFLDIGANTGWYTMLSAHLSDKVRVCSFEPIPEHLDTLRRSIDLNDMADRVTVYPFGLSSKNGTETIHASGSGSSLIKEFTDSDARPEQIEIRTLDSLAVAGADFIKMDIEGHELEALRGAIETLERHRPILFVEIAYTLRNLGRDFVNPHFVETFELLGSMGYRAQALEQNVLRDFDYLSETPDGVRMYLFTSSDQQA